MDARKNKGGAIWYNINFLSNFLEGPYGLKASFANHEYIVSVWNICGEDKIIGSRQESVIWPHIRLRIKLSGPNFKLAGGGLQYDPFDVFGQFVTPVSVMFLFNLNFSDFLFSLAARKQKCHPSFQSSKQRPTFTGLCAVVCIVWEHAVIRLVSSH